MSFYAYVSLGEDKMMDLLRKSPCWTKKQISSVEYKHLDTDRKFLVWRVKEIAFSCKKIYKVTRNFEAENVSKLEVSG